MLATEHQFEVIRKSEHPHPRDRQFLDEVTNFLSIPLTKLVSSTLFHLSVEMSEEEVRGLCDSVLGDSLTDTVTRSSDHSHQSDWVVEVSYKKGVTDNLANTAKSAVADYLERSLTASDSVSTTRRYYLWGKLGLDEVRQVVNEVLSNELIEDSHIYNLSTEPQAIALVNLEVSDDRLIDISRKGQLALNLEEMHAIRDYFRQDTVKLERLQHTLGSMPTDVELEAIAQTWSEHCKHKIFAARITYRENDTEEVIDSIFNSYIKAATSKISAERDWLVSVFKDNAGVIRFTDTHNLVFKVETHNSPSALDPYGGALTGILGVNRDVMGTGIGARLLANTDVFCFAPPNYDKPLPPRLLHPKRVFQGVRLGVEHGGNKSGVPTVNGSLVFDDRYLGKPLVYCGSVGIMPRVINEQPTEVKEIKAGDLIVVAGGRTGKDGIHGATFSSEELNETSPTSAVQIGDPFTQKKLHDFILEARDAGLYRTITDNGAGGFSSSVGELAELSGGCELHLDRAPLKYDGLLPWEILVSESQERMTLAVPAENLCALQQIACKHEVEVTSIGTFTDSKRFHVLHNKQTVAYLDLDFLHNGVPQLQLEAEWRPPKYTSINYPEKDYGSLLTSLLSQPNVCSKESIIRQYDHEVQGGTVVKPLCGVLNDGPSDAAVVWPVECMDGNSKSPAGVIISNGICPRYSDLDCYHMAAVALDEAVRNCVATGADPDHIAVLDNFCWPDPVFDPDKTPDGKQKLAQLVRACKGLYDTAVALGTPLISGKDSMKNDYRIANTKISIPPTLLVSAIAKIPDVSKSVTMDLKAAGDLVYVVGLTRPELGASELHRLLGAPLAGLLPMMRPEEARQLYSALHEAMELGLVASCHDCSDGGLAVALAESAFAGGFGMRVDLDSLACVGPIGDIEKLFSESAGRFVVSIKASSRQRFEKLLENSAWAHVGESTEAPQLRIYGRNGDKLMDCQLEDLKSAWQNTLVNQM